MGIQLDPRVKRFQEIKARAKKAAIEQKEGIAKILQVSPHLTEKQAKQVLEAHKRQQEYTTRKIGNNNVKVFQA